MCFLLSKILLCNIINYVTILIIAHFFWKSIGVDARSQCESTVDVGLMDLFH